MPTHAQKKIGLKHRLIYWLYAFLSWLPDIHQIGPYNRAIVRVRAIILGWQPNKKIGRGTIIGSACHIPATTQLEIEEDCIIRENVTISGNLKLGTNTRILAHTTIDASGGVKIGSNTQVGRSNHIFSHNHDVSSRKIPVLQSPEVFEVVDIGDDVMLFSQVTIMPGVQIGTGAVAAYGSIVTKKLDEYGIYAGSPARKIGERT